MIKIMSIVTKTASGPSLSQGCYYEIIGLSDRSFRIIDDSQEPALYPKSYFYQAEDRIEIPQSWIFRHLSFDEYSCVMPIFASRGFFERHADGEADAVRIFEEYLKNRSTLGLVRVQDEDS